MRTLRLVHDQRVVLAVHLVEARHIDQHHLVAGFAPPAVVLDGGRGAADHVGRHAGTRQQRVDQRTLAAADLAEQRKVDDFQLAAPCQFLQLAAGGFDVDTRGTGGLQVRLQFGLRQWRGRLPAPAPGRACNTPDQPQAEAQQHAGKTGHQHHHPGRRGLQLMPQRQGELRRAEQDRQQHQYPDEDAGRK